jgi:hypothetical protein
VEVAISRFLVCLANSLPIDSNPNGQRSFAVGGIIARKEYVVYGRTDANFIDGNQNLLLST